MMVAWREVLNLTLAIDDGILYVVARWDGTPVLWGPPLGPNVAVRHVNRAFALLRELGAARPQVLYVWEDYALWRVLRSATHVRIVAQAFEYIYDARQLATLAGSDFRTKRKERARVARDESVAWRRYDNAFAADCVALLDQWIAQKRERVAERDLAKFETEARVCRRALTDELPLSGVVLLVD
ncbi:MAG TPA: phosphatidylglycerol lysyltransferase domain-containing protein, partial [Thermoanaerobaculia bacterium]|nr:phosphatidylglycerol lysyltransferase domain-containing protein [Thermoanaerobaculia bacterium]